MSVTIRASGVRVTERAVQIDLDGERHWLPKSQIESIDGDTVVNQIVGFANNELHEFVVSDWVAREKGFVLNAEIYETRELQPRLGQAVYGVMAGDMVVCRSSNRQHADMIAAALNLTHGKN